MCSRYVQLFSKCVYLTCAGYISQPPISLQRVAITCVTVVIASLDKVYSVHAAYISLLQ